jgi:hypothetical protein
MTVNTGDPFNDTEGDTALLFKLMQVGYGSNLSSEATIVFIIIN